MAVFTALVCNTGSCQLRVPRQGDGLSAFSVRFDPDGRFMRLHPRHRFRPHQPGVPEYPVFWKSSSGHVPHTGATFDVESESDTVLRWLEPSPAKDPSEAARLREVELVPQSAVHSKGPQDDEQFIVRAIYTDASRSAT